MQKEGIYPAMSNQDYHVTDSLGSSDLKILLHSYGHYKAMEKKTTPAMMFGTASHSIILEDDETNIIKVKGSPKTNEFKDAMEFYPGKAIVCNADYELILQMKEVFFKHDLAKQLIKLGKAEQSFFWDDEMFEGIQGKCKPDYMIDDLKYLIDYKTSIDFIDISSFPRTCMKFGYDVSASWYVRGVNKLLPFKTTFANEPENAVIETPGSWQFIIIAQEKFKPFAIQVYICNKDFIELGGRKINVALNNYINGQKINAYGEKTLQLAPPSWAMGEY